MKYRIEFQRNNDCDFPFERVTNHLVVALWYLFTLMLKYPIITLKIVRGDGQWLNVNGSGFQKIESGAFESLKWEDDPIDAPSAIAAYEREHKED